MATVTSPEVLPPMAEAVADTEPLFEIIDGQRVELPPMSAFASRIASRLVTIVNIFAGARGLGEAVVEVLFHLALPIDRNRRPDGAYVSYLRWSKGRPMPARDNAWNVVPNVAVEVISPNDLAADLMEKIEEYFKSGVELVWVVYPCLGIIHVYESFTHIRVLTKSDELEGGAVLPGFRLPLKDLFQEETTQGMIEGLAADGHAQVVHRRVRLESLTYRVAAVYLVVRGCSTAAASRATEKFTCPSPRHRGGRGSGENGRAALLRERTNAHNQAMASVFGRDGTSGCRPSTTGPHMSSRRTANQGRATDSRRRSSRRRCGRFSWSALLASPLVLAALGTVGAQVASLPAATASADESKSDLRLTLRVRQAMQKDVTLVGVTTLGVTVRSGIATLWGQVPSAAVARRAVEIVRQVTGIVEVRNELQVPAADDPLAEFLRLPTPRRPDGGPDKLWFLANRPPSAPLTSRDEEPGSARAEAQADKSPENGTGIALLPPIALGTSPAAAKASSAVLPELAERVAQLQKNQPRFSTVQAQVEGGIVRLRGSVKRREDLFDLAQLIARLPGVERVILVEVRTSR